MNELNYASFGKLLIKLQFLETIIKLFISLCNSSVKENKKYRIKELSSRNILDNNTEKTKQTLGQLMIIIKSEIPNFDNAEFKELLSKRNKFIHSFHKEFLSKKEIDEKEVTKFIEKLWSLTDKYTKVFTGLISISAKSIGKGKVSVEGIEEDEKHLYNYLIENSKQTAYNND